MNLLYRIRGIRKIVVFLQTVIFNLMYERILGNAVSIFGFPIITRVKGSRFHFGKKVALVSSSHFNAPGIYHPVIIRLMASDSKLVVGHNVGMSGVGICVQKSITIGENVLLGANVFITDTDFHPIDIENRRRSKNNIKSSKVVVENNVFIGMNSIVLKGVTIGENSIIGAGSVVAKSVPANEIWAGNPAKFIKKLSIN